MKKLTAALAGLSVLALSVAFAAPPAIASGTFSGDVGGLCVLKSAAFNDVSEFVEGGEDSDGFFSELTGSADFTFRSNTACTADTDVTEFTVAPGEEEGDFEASCEVPVQTVLATAQTASAGIDADINAKLVDKDDLVLLEGGYSLTCTVTVQAAP